VTVADHNHAWAYDAQHVLRCPCGAWIDRTESRRGIVRDQKTGTLCRIERMTSGRWERQGADVRLLYPEKVPERYAAHGKAARAVELGDDLQPTGRVWEPETQTCPWCETTHPAPFDGECLI